MLENVDRYVNWLIDQKEQKIFENKKSKISFLKWLFIKIITEKEYKKWILDGLSIVKEEGLISEFTFRRLKNLNQKILFEVEDEIFKFLYENSEKLRPPLSFIKLLEGGLIIFLIVLFLFVTLNWVIVKFILNKLSGQML